jgi:hypothetical protein
VDPVTEHWLREWGAPPAPGAADLLTALAAAAAGPRPEPAAFVSGPFAAFGAGEMAVFARVRDEREAAELGDELAERLDGVALLQDETRADGITQWVLGRAP